MSQQRVPKPRTRVQRNTRTEVIDQDTRSRGQKEREALAAELDDLLDDIDAALGENEIENVEEFLAAYVQKGGE